MGDKKGKKKAANTEEDDSTNQLTRIYKRRCEQNGVNGNKMFREKLDNALNDGEHLEKVQLFEEMGPIGVRALMDSFSEIPYKHLKVLKLWKVKAQDEGVRCICNYMIKSKVLEVLDLLDNEITTLGCEFLGKALHPSQEVPLIKLKLDHNNFGNEGLQQLVFGLAMNNVLERLSICYCGIQTDGAKYIQQIVGNLNSKLVKLKIQGNKLKNQGVLEVFRALEINEIIEKIYLADNQLNLQDNETNKGVLEIILRTMEKSSNLVFYDFCFNQMGEEDGVSIFNKFDANKNIYKLILPEHLSAELLGKLKKVKRKPKKKKKKGKKGKK